MIKETKSIMKKNGKKIILFEFIFKILTLLIAIPVFLNMFKLIMKFTGYKYLTLENIFSFVLNPITLVLLLILLIIIAFYSIFDMGTIIILLDASKQNKEMNLKDAVRLSFKKSIRIYKPSNLGLLLLVLFLIPFFNIGVGSGVITSIKIPEFIMDYINANKVLCSIYTVGIVLLISLLLRWMYSLHYYFLENKTFKEAHKSSTVLSKKSNLRDLWDLTWPQILLYVAYILLVVIEILVIVVINNVLHSLALLDSVLISIIVILMMISLVIFSIVSTVFGSVCTSALFYKHKEQKGEKVQHIDVNEIDEKFTKTKWRYIEYTFILLSVIGTTILTYGVVKGKYNLNIEYIRNMEITAHRGASVLYPENTMAAFKGAKELGADWIELDVQQTKDMKIIVSHDTNFKRVSGVDMNSWEATYEEIKELDVGSFKDEKYKDERVPLLDDVIKWAKENNIKLNIELKPTGREEGFEKQVIDIIKENGFENDCVITSQVYEVLENAKKADQNIVTVYVMSLAFGDITSLDKADYFSVEATSITSDMVSKIHKEGKQIYGWTVNTEEGINKMINLNVDNIITDDITLGKKLVAESKNSNLITEIVNGIQSIFGKN